MPEFNSDKVHKYFASDPTPEQEELYFEGVRAAYDQDIVRAREILAKLESLGGAPGLRRDLHRAIRIVEGNGVF